MIALIYVYDGGRYHEVVADGIRFSVVDDASRSIHSLDEFMTFLRSVMPINDVMYCNGPPPGQLSDYRRGCFRHRRPVSASLDRPCCPEAAAEIYTWWDEIKTIHKEFGLR